MATVMISTGENGRTLLMIGLEPENIDRIEQGDPFMHRGRSEYGFPLSSVDVVIFKGTPEEIQRDMATAGVGAKRTLDLRNKSEASSSDGGSGKLM